MHYWGRFHQDPCPSLPEGARTIPVGLCELSGSFEILRGPSESCAVWDPLASIAIGSDSRIQGCVLIADTIGSWIFSVVDDSFLGAAD